MASELKVGDHVYVRGIVTEVMRPGELIVVTLERNDAISKWLSTANGKLAASDALFTRIEEGSELANFEVSGAFQFFAESMGIDLVEKDNETI